MRRGWLFLALLVVGVALVAVVGLRRVPPCWSANDVGGDMRDGVWADDTVGQTFVSPYPGLYRIDVRLIPAAARTAHLVTFHLRDDPGAVEDLYAERFEASEVVRTAYRSFEFPPIADSAGRTMAFVLSAPDAEPGRGISVRRSSEDTLPGGQAYLSGTAAPGDVVFRACYDPPLPYRLLLLLDRLVASRPGLWGDRTTYVLLLGAYVLLTGLLTRRVLLVARQQD